VLQCVAVCCSVLQCVVEMVQRIAQFHKVGTLCCGVLRCVAVCCSVLQCLLEMVQRMCVCMPVCVYVYACVCMQVCVDVCVCVYANTCGCLCVRVKENRLSMGWLRLVGSLKS